MKGEPAVENLVLKPSKLGTPIPDAEVAAPVFLPADPDRRNAACLILSDPAA